MTGLVRQGIFPAGVALFVALVLLSGFFWYDYPWEVMRFPVASGIATITICLFLLMRTQVKPDDDAAEQTRSPTIAALWLLAVIPFLLLFGFRAGFPLYALVYVFGNTRKPGLAALAAAITFALVYGIFTLVLNHPLPGPFWLT